MRYYLYILASRHHRHLSLGVTSDLKRGITNHRLLVNRRLRKKRVMQKLVYIESMHSVDDAVEREYVLKRSSRLTLERLIGVVNPGWDTISVSDLIAAGYDKEQREG